MASLRPPRGFSTDRWFERLHRRHVDDVYRYALAVLQHAADAEAVTRTTFANAYHALQRGERPLRPRSWLISIAHGLCRRRHRDELPDEAHTDATHADLREALARLAFTERAALVMREVEDRSCPEIAGILGLPVTAVEATLFRARRALREQLEGTLRCLEAERAISRLADGHLERAERSSLRAHLRECGDCRRLARGVHAQRAAFRALASVPVPPSVRGERAPARAVGLGTGLAQVSRRPGI